jgi:hypothetical protein
MDDGVGVFLSINMDHTPPEKAQLFQVAAAPPTLSLLIALADLAV